MAGDAGLHVPVAGAAEVLDLEVLAVDGAADADVIAFVVVLVGLIAGRATVDGPVGDGLVDAGDDRAVLEEGLVGKADVIADDIAVKGGVENVDGVDHLGAGVGVGEGQAGARDEVVNDLHHGQAFGAGVEVVVGAGGEGLVGGGDVAGGLGQSDAVDAVGDDADLDAGAGQSPGGTYRIAAMHGVTLGSDRTGVDDAIGGRADALDGRVGGQCVYLVVGDLGLHDAEGL